MRLAEFWLRYRKSRLAVVGAATASIFVLISIFAPFITPFPPFEQHLENKFLPPSSVNIFGTDQLGRDLLSRVIFGTRISMMIGLLVTLLSTLIGILVGACGAFVGGEMDELLMRITDLTYCLPTFFLILTALALFGPNLINLVLVMGTTMWPVTARLIRAEVLSVKEKDYVLASKVCGVGSATILFSEVLPNAIYSVIVASTLRTATAILYEASLSFLGLGDPSLVSWGWIIRESLPFIRIAWWMPIFPGIVLSTLVIAINLTGDGLNDALNPQLKER